MKKVLTLILAALLMLSLSLTAFADTRSPSASPDDPTGVGPESPRPPAPPIGTPDSGTVLPEDEDAEGGCDCRIVAWPNREILPGNKKQIFEDARACLEEACPEGYSCLEFIYHEQRTSCLMCNVLMTEDPEHFTWDKAAAQEGNVKCCNAVMPGGELLVCRVCTDKFPVQGFEAYAAKQYVDGEWVERDVVVVDDTYVAVIFDLVDGPLALFAR